MARSRWFFAPCPRGLEDTLANEIQDHKPAEIRVERGGVGFRGPATLGYAVCLWSRVAGRVYEELTRAKIRHADDLYEVAQRVDWNRYLRPGQTFAVSAVTRSPLLDHSHYGALKIKDGIVDQLRERLGSRPDVDPEAPDLPLRLHVRGKVATLSRDLAGHSLHKRGYRDALHRSPLNEALAAGLIRLSGWDGTSSVCDPMCGSGTFLIEAGWIAGDRAPGLTRTFAFEGWSDRDRAGWDALKAEAHRREEVGRANIPTLIGNDRHPSAIAIAKRAAAKAGLPVRFFEVPIETFQPPLRPAFAFVNPPYGDRLDEPDVIPSYEGLGRWLRDHCDHGWILAGNPELTRHLHLKAERRIPIRNGNIDCRWLHYPIRSVL